MTLYIMCMLPIVVMLHPGAALGEEARDPLADVRAGRGVARRVPAHARAHVGAFTPPPPPLPATATTLAIALTKAHTYLVRYRKILVAICTMWKELLLKTVQVCPRSNIIAVDSSELARLDCYR